MGYLDLAAFSVNFVKILNILACSAEKQARYLEAVDENKIGISAEELVLEFDDYLVVVKEHFRELKWNQDVVNRLNALEAILHHMLKHSDKSVFYIENLLDSAEWCNVRQVARNAIEAIEKLGKEGSLVNRDS